jgi:hypothetical protein
MLGPPPDGLDSSRKGRRAPAKALHVAEVNVLLAHRSTSAKTRAGLPVPGTSLSGATITTAPVCGSVARLARLGEAVLARAEEEAVDGEGRVEGVGGAGVGADGLDADADRAVTRSRECGRR